MSAAKSQRKRSRPVKKQNPLEQKGVKFGIGIVLLIVVIAVAAYVLMSGPSDKEYYRAFLCYNLILRSKFLTLPFKTSGRCIQYPAPSPAP